MTKNGYGRRHVGGGRRDLAHRVAYREAYGKIPDGHIVHHLCGVKLCVNPDHLLTTTQRIHVQKLDARRPWSEVCKRGHDLDERANGHRFCRVCANRSKRRHYRRNRERILAQQRERYAAGVAS